MPQTVKKHGGRGGYRPGSGRPRTSPRVQAYAAGVATGLTKTAARARAGYSPACSTGKLDRLPGVRRELETIEQQRDTLQQSPQLSFRGIAKRLVSRATSPRVTPKIQTDNDKTLISMMGYNAPTQVSVRSIGMLIELADLSAADLVAVRDAMRGNDDTMLSAVSSAACEREAVDA